MWSSKRNVSFWRTYIFEKCFLGVGCMELDMPVCKQVSWGYYILCDILWCHVRMWHETQTATKHRARWLLSHHVEWWMNLNNFELLPSDILKMYEKSQGWLADVIVDVSSIIEIIDEDKRGQQISPSMFLRKSRIEWISLSNS